MMNINNTIDMIDGMDVVPLEGGEELNDEVIDAFTSLFEALVLHDNLDSLVATLEAVKELKENDATKCTIMYIATLFLTEAVKSNLSQNL